MDDDIALTRRLAALLGWEVVGSDIQKGRSYDFSGPHIYIDEHGDYWRGVRSDGSATVRWRPLHSMDDAWMVVEHLRMRTEGDRYWGEVRTPFDDADRYYAGFTLWGFTGWNGVADFDAVADTPARALCLAALAVGEETKG